MRWAFILYKSECKCDMNCSQDFQCLVMISLLAMALLRIYSMSLSMVLFENNSCILDFSVVQLISFYRPIFLIFSFV
jgi:hypothetical protein